jgi:hypothetical protein
MPYVCKLQEPDKAHPGLPPVPRHAKRPHGAAASGSADLPAAASSTSQESVAATSASEEDSVEVAYALPVTRSIGHLRAHEEVGLLAEPEIGVRRLRQGSDLFVVLGSASLWCVLSNEAVCDIVAASKSPIDAAQRLAQQGRADSPSPSVTDGPAPGGIREASQGRITCIVVWFRWMDDSEARRESRQRERKQRAAEERQMSLYDDDQPALMLEAEPATSFGLPARHSLHEKPSSGSGRVATAAKPEMQQAKDESPTRTQTQRRSGIINDRTAVVAAADDDNDGDDDNRGEKRRAVNARPGPGPASCAGSGSADAESSGPPRERDSPPTASARVRLALSTSERRLAARRPGATAESASVTGRSHDEADVGEAMTRGRYRSGGRRPQPMQAHGRRRRLRLMGNT